MVKIFIEGLGWHEFVGFVQIPKEFIVDEIKTIKLQFVQKVVDTQILPVAIPRGGFEITTRKVIDLAEKVVKKSTPLTLNTPKLAARVGVLGYSIDYVSVAIDRLKLPSIRRCLRFYYWGFTRKTRLGRCVGLTCATGVTVYDVYECGRFFLKVHPALDVLGKGLNASAEILVKHECGFNESPLVSDNEFVNKCLEFCLGDECVD